MAENTVDAELYEEAELAFKKAVELLPANYDLVRRSVSNIVRFQ